MKIYRAIVDDQELGYFTTKAKARVVFRALGKGSGIKFYLELEEIEVN